MRVARGAFGDLDALSCLSASARIAVAFTNGEGAAPAATERWNGRAWSVIAPIPDRVAGGAARPGDVVACASVRACAADLPADDGAWIVLRWNGSVWTEPLSAGSWYHEITVESGTPPGRLVRFALAVHSRRL